MRLCVLWLLLLLPVAAHAENEAKTFFERGTALFALRHYAEAAVAYEKSFELRPEPAILYNAAQAYRLAGNKTRALDLYDSLIKLYGTKISNRAQILEHIKNLKLAIEADRLATNAPPNTPAPPPPTTTLTETPPTPLAPKPVAKRKWLWPVIGTSIAIVVGGVAAGIVVGTSKTIDPSPSFGNVRAN